MRKTKVDWLQAGLRILGQAGLSGLTIDAMADVLGMTKGSFYHHFENIEDFERRLLDFWANQYLSTAGSLPEAPQERLALLDAIMEQAFSPITEPETAIRLWGQQNDLARSYVEQVDAFRRGLVHEIFLGLVPDARTAQLVSDLLFTMMIGSMTALPRVPAQRVLELYQEIKRVYGL